jgi:hypothetical protein
VVQSASTTIEHPQVGVLVHLEPHPVEPVYLVLAVRPAAHHPKGFDDLVDQHWLSRQLVAISAIVVVLARFFVQVEPVVFPGREDDPDPRDRGKTVEDIVWENGRALAVVQRWHLVEDVVHGFIHGVETGDERARCFGLVKEAVGRLVLPARDDTEDFEIREEVLGADMERPTR